MGTEHLSAAQFAAQANAGGASRRVRDASVPTTGYMVGVPGFEERHRPPVTEGQVAAHRVKIAISGADPEDHQGAWRAARSVRGRRQGDVVVLDKSRREPDRSRAEALGRAGHQDALWHLDTHDEVPLHGGQFGRAVPARLSARRVRRGTEATTSKGTTVVRSREGVERVRVTRG